MGTSAPVASVTQQNIWRVGLVFTLREYGVPEGPGVHASLYRQQLGMGT